MELYIGGRAQGKLNYVLTKYPKAECFDENNFTLLTNWEAKEIIVWNHFHLSMKKMIGEMGVEKAKAYVRETISQQNNLVIISDEIGNGIVPMDESDRVYREETGRMLVEIAGKAVRVERIICGLAQVIK